MGDPALSLAGLVEDKSKAANHKPGQWANDRHAPPRKPPIPPVFGAHSHSVNAGRKPPPSRSAAAPPMLRRPKPVVPPPPDKQPLIKELTTLRHYYAE